MKIKKWKEINHKEKGIILFTILSILLIIGVFFYQSFAVFQVSKKQNLIEGNIDELGDIEFAFYYDGKIQNEMPQKEKGYQLDEVNSYCSVKGQKDADVIPSLDRETWSIVVTGLKTTKTKCFVHFKKSYDDNKIYDLSGNHYDGTFMGGAKVQTDLEGQLGIYFDGESAYVDVDDLPDTIDWTSGFTVETQIKALDLDHWTRILDFGVGMEDNNILLAVGTKDIQSYFEFSSRYDTTINAVTKSDDFIFVNELLTIKCEVIDLADKYFVKVYKNNVNVLNQIFDTHEFIKNILRSSNYLGKSNWSQETHNLHGYIYSLKFTDSNGKAFLWYDF